MFSCGGLEDPLGKNREDISKLLRLRHFLNIDMCVFYFVLSKLETEF